MLTVARRPQASNSPANASTALCDHVRTGAIDALAMIDVEARCGIRRSTFGEGVRRPGGGSAALSTHLRSPDPPDPPRVLHRFLERRDALLCTFHGDMRLADEIEMVRALLRQGRRMAPLPFPRQSRRVRAGGVQAACLDDPSAREQDRVVGAPIENPSAGHCVDWLI